MHLVAGNNEQYLRCLANAPESPVLPLHGNYRKRSPDPSEGTQAECQDITTNQHPTTVSIVPYGTVTKYHCVAASKCEQHAQLATGTSFSEELSLIVQDTCCKCILAVGPFPPSVHLVDIDVTHTILNFIQGLSPIFAYYK